MNVPIHKEREAARPPTPMREELPVTLACKLFSAPNQEEQVEGHQVQVVQNKTNNNEMNVMEIVSDNTDDLIFKLEL